MNWLTAVEGCGLVESAPPPPLKNSLLWCSLPSQCCLWSASGFGLYVPLLSSSSWGMRYPTPLAFSKKTSQSANFYHCYLMWSTQQRRQFLAAWKSPLMSSICSIFHVHWRVQSTKMTPKRLKFLKNGTYQGLLRNQTCKNLLYLKLEPKNLKAPTKVSTSTHSTIESHTLAIRKLVFLISENQNSL